MLLRKLPLKPEYRSLRENVIQDFYIPVLNDAVSYKRGTGYFSSTSLVEITKGIAALAERGGKIQIIASPFLSSEDVKAIRQGYTDRDKIIEKTLLSQILNDDPVDYFSMERMNLLANLISKGIMDIRIALTVNKNGYGMYHEKVGVIEDVSGDKIAFSGSNNETAAAMFDNFETMDVFRSWGDDSESDRVISKEESFDKLWENDTPKMAVLKFPNVTDALIDKYKKGPPNFNIDKEQFPEIERAILERSKNEHPVGARVPPNIELRDYQKEAIAVWVGENYRGIFDMATGTGKTLTGLGAVSKLSEDLGDRLAVIILCPYQHLVEQWVEDIVKFNIDPIIAYSRSPQKDWRKRLDKAIRDQKTRDDKRFFCLICTNATFSGKAVQEAVSKIRTPILLVADEAHNVGAASYSRLLDDRFAYRLALSATLERHSDEEGTAKLYDFFGKKCIEYSIERAIKEDKLTRYKYYPIPVHLKEDELAEYAQLSYEMSKCVIKGKNGKYKLNRRGEILAMQRARIVAGAREKLDALRQYIKPYRDDHNILVYCGATNVIDEKRDVSETDEEDIRQILAVTSILGNEMKMDVAKFTSDEDMQTREWIKDQFIKQELQALVAIKCLDEGMNIPGIRTAFILASTTNPKEYIQRRGRVLRKAPGKSFAEIYDFITLPRELDTVSSLTEDQARRDYSLVKNEIKRMREFGEISMNPMDANKLIWEIQDAYHLTSIDIDRQDAF